MTTATQNARKVTASVDVVKAVTIAQDMAKRPSMSLAQAERKYVNLDELHEQALAEAPYVVCEGHDGTVCASSCQTPPATDTECTETECPYAPNGRPNCPLC